MEPPLATNRDLTGLLNRGLAGDSDANRDAFEAVYGELRRNARRQMRRGRVATLSPTALVSEFYLKLGSGAPRAVKDRIHFFSLAARAMRQVLLDHQRARQAARRGGQVFRVDLATEPQDGAAEAIDYVELDLALSALKDIDSRAAQVVDWHYFSGLNFQEIAELLDVSVKTARRDWDSARAFLLSHLSAA